MLISYCQARIVYINRCPLRYEEFCEIEEAENIFTEIVIVGYRATRMEYILVAVSLACVMTIVSSGCPFADPCDVATRTTCGAAGISMFACICQGCCYDTTTRTCYEKGNICHVLSRDLTTECPGSRTAIESRGECVLAKTDTCGVGVLEEIWACDNPNNGPDPISTTFARCCCDTPCPGGSKCGIPTEKRTACLDVNAAPIQDEAPCFTAGCCYDDGSTIPCYEPNLPPIMTCDMVYKGCL